MAETLQRPAFSKREDGRAWPAQGKWTYEDYLRLPDDGRRYEIIRGRLYVTAAPFLDHQYVVAQLYRHFGNFAAETRLGVVLGAPIDILLPSGIAAPVQPDLLFLRTGNLPRWGDKSFAGVPDLVVEVLSRSTGRRDRTIKLAAYRDAGVPEYWLVDPWTRTVLVYLLSEDRTRSLEPVRYGMGEAVVSTTLPGLRIEVADLFPQV